MEPSQDWDTRLSDSKAHVPKCWAVLPAAAALPGTPMHTPLRQGPLALLVPVGPDRSTSFPLTSRPVCKCLCPLLVSVPQLTQDAAAFAASASRVICEWETPGLQGLFRSTSG